MSDKLNLYFHTLRHLKFRQVQYRLWYLIRNRFFKKGTPVGSRALPANSPQFLKGINAYTSYKGNGQFSFLNLGFSFDKSINWNHDGYGKLWTYNLNYFDFLNQAEMPKEEGLNLIHQYIEDFPKLKDGLEPFPISLRLINWVKFLASNEISEDKINESLDIQTQLLIRNLEFHLLGNHLLENGFGLFFAAHHLQNKSYLAKAEKILRDELKEQILKDGAHFELSPMYHQIMLFRVLDCYNLAIQNNPFTKQDLQQFLKSKAEKMLGALETMTFNDGSIPLLNDSAEGIAPGSKALFAYAKKLGLHWEETLPSDSGYRKIAFPKYESIIDIGKVGPDYIPGHAHSDSLQFLLHANGKPLLVDTGTSTYEKNAKRTEERATSAHNTVQIGEVEQTQVWGGFRVAKRAYTKILKDQGTIFSAEHDGYRSIGGKHQRDFSFEESKVEIIDTVQANQKYQVKAYLHFHPAVKISLEGNVLTTNLGTINFENHLNIELEDYEYAPEFNKRIPAKKATIYFSKTLKTTIHL